MASMEWIDVRDWLPDVRGDYLVVAEEKHNDDERYVIVMHYYLPSKEWSPPVCFHADGIFDYPEIVTHWMPLPRPPMLASEFLAMG